MKYGTALPCRIIISSLFAKNADFSLFDSSPGAAPGNSGFEKLYTERNEYNGTAEDKNGMPVIIFGEGTGAVRIEVAEKGKKLLIERTVNGVPAKTDIVCGAVSESLYPTVLGKIPLRTKGEKISAGNFSSFPREPFEIILSYLSEIKGTDLQRISMRITVKERERSSHGRQ